MVKEPKNIDFYTTGRQPSEQDFIRISEWIKKDKQRKSNKLPRSRADEVSKQAKLLLM